MRDKKQSVRESTIKNYTVVRPKPSSKPAKPSPPPSKPKAKK